MKKLPVSRLLFHVAKFFRAVYYPLKVVVFQTKQSINLFLDFFDLF